MKISFMYLTILLVASSCSTKSYFGADFEVTEAKSVDTVIDLINTDSETDELIVQGKVIATCQNSGCWMHLTSSQDEILMVTFKDYGFFVPKKMTGKTVLIKGVGTKKITSVDELRHYAQDAGKPKNEIDAITEPEATYTFVATGVKMIER